MGRPKADIGRQCSNRRDCKSTAQKLKPEKNSALLRSLRTAIDNDWARQDPDSLSSSCSDLSCCRSNGSALQIHSVGDVFSRLNSVEIKARLASAGENQDWFMTGKPSDGQNSSYTPALDDLASAISQTCENYGGTSVLPHLQLVHGPEKMVRSRYKSEGCRAPIKGLGHGTFPTVKVNNYSGPVTIVAHLETADGEPHPNNLIQSTANEDASEEVTMPNWVAGITLQCDADMTAIFDNLAIRRLNKDAVSKLRMMRLSKFTKSTANDDGIVAFRAFLPGCTAPFSTVRSQPFACVVPAEPAVIDLVHPTIGSAAGGDTIVLVGRKYKAGFIVTFCTDDWSARGIVDKHTSNQNCAVVQVPAFMNKTITERVDVEIYVTTGPSKEPLRSDSAKFTYAPELQRNEHSLFSTTYPQSSQVETMSPPSSAAPQSVAPASDPTDGAMSLIDSMFCDVDETSHLSANSLDIPAPHSVSADSGLSMSSPTVLNSIDASMTGFGTDFSPAANTTSATDNRDLMFGLDLDSYLRPASNASHLSSSLTPCTPAAASPLLPPIAEESTLNTAVSNSVISTTPLGAGFASPAFRTAASSNSSNGGSHLASTLGFFKEQPQEDFDFGMGFGGGCVSSASNITLSQLSASTAQPIVAAPTATTTLQMPVSMPAMVPPTMSSPPTTTAALLASEVGTVTDRNTETLVTKLLEFQQQQQAQKLQQTLSRSWDWIDRQVAAFCDENPMDEHRKMIQIMSQKRDLSVLTIFQKTLPLCSDLTNNQGLRPEVIFRQFLVRAMEEVNKRSSPMSAAAAAPNCAI